jgi:acyl-CoA dehydrogenase
MNNPVDVSSLGYGRSIFSPEHDTFRDGVRDYFRSFIEPNILEWEKRGGFPAEVFREAGKRGILCAGIPEVYGGMGGDFLHHVVLHEEHGFSVAGASMEAGACTDGIAYAILLGGTEEQKKEWLPRFASGEVIAEIAVSEAHSGSDVKAIKTVARRDGDDYLISGHKMWVTNGPISNLLIVAARINDAAEESAKHSSIKLFLVDRAHVKGVEVSPPTPLMYHGAGMVSQVFFDEVRVPKTAILGGEAGQGMRSALQVITTARLCLSARMLAACELALKLTIDFTQNRVAFGERVIDFQNSRFKLAQVKTEIAVGRAFVDDTLRRNSQGPVDATQAAMAKLWVSDLEGRVMDECLQLFGGLGFSAEYPISKMYAFARAHKLYQGTSEILRLAISRTLD